MSCNCSRTVQGKHLPTHTTPPPPTFKFPLPYMRPESGSKSGTFLSKLKINTENFQMSEAFHTTLLIGKTMQGSWPWSMEQTIRIPLSSKHEPQSCWDIGYQVLASCTALSKQIRDRSLWGMHLFITEYVRKDKLLKVLNIHVYNSLRYMLFALATLERGTLQETLIRKTQSPTSWGMTSLTTTLTHYLNLPSVTCFVLLGSP